MHALHILPVKPPRHAETVSPLRDLKAAAALLLTLERRRPAAAAHSRRVAELGVRVGEELRLDARTLGSIRLASLFHDIGKLAVSPRILDKPSSLTPAERAAVERHVQVGAQVACDTGLPTEVVRILAQHHERLDGSGYPNRLHGGMLELGARIVGVCDVYDALTSERPYAAAWSRDRALAHLLASGGAFDLRCVHALQRIVAPEPLQVVSLLAHRQRRATAASAPGRLALESGL